MAKRTPPAFQFYPSDWLGSTRIALMTPEQEGAYIRLLAHAWADDDCSLPADEKALAVLSRLGARWAKHGRQILDCFEPHPTRPDRIVNGKLHNLRAYYDDRSQRGAVGGRRSAEVRWGGKQEGKQRRKQSSKQEGEQDGKQEADSSVSKPQGNGKPSSSTPVVNHTGRSQKHRVQQETGRPAGPVNKPPPWAAGDEPTQDPDEAQVLSLRQQVLVSDLRELTGESDRVGFYRRIVGRLPEAAVHRVKGELNAAIRDPAVAVENRGALLTTIAKRIASELGVALFDEPATARRAGAA